MADSTNAVQAWLVKQGYARYCKIADKTGKYDGAIYVFTYTRKMAEKLIGQDIRPFAQSSDTIRSLIDMVNDISFEENLAAIMSSPKKASNSYAYISLHKEEYEKISEIGKEALPQLVEILKGEDKGLRGNIAMLLCEDIVKRLLNENQGVDLETEKLIKEAQTTIDKWKVIMGNTSQEMMPDLTEEEVAKARAVVEEYYRAVAAKDAEAVLATMHPREGLTLERVKNCNVQLFGEEKRTLLSIDYNSQDNMRKGYRPCGKYVKPENIIVFKVSFNIDYPDKVMGLWNEGIYDNWSMILIRDSKNSPWLIYDQGY